MYDPHIPPATYLLTSFPPHNFPTSTTTFSITTLCYLSCNLASSFLYLPTQPSHEIDEMYFNSSKKQVGNFIRGDFFYLPAKTESLFNMVLSVGKKN